VAQGATLVAGGTRDGAFYEPTVLTGVTPEMDVYREELFGPAGVVYKVAGEDEAVKIANDTSFGLGSYVYTTDPEQAERVANKIDAGMVYVNLVLADSPELPFGESSAPAPRVRWVCSPPTSSSTRSSSAPRRSLGDGTPCPPRVPFAFTTIRRD
jgi:Aldehyde dehydrogenase family